MSNPNGNDPNNTNLNKKRPCDYYSNQPTKKPNHIIFYDEENDNIDDEDEDFYNYLSNINELKDTSDENKELVIIDKEITCLVDLIELGKLYQSNKKYNIDLYILSKLVEPLTELNNMIGMESVKQDMVDHILFRIQNLDNKNSDMMHTVIQGPPGVGKTEVAKIIGKIYLAMGILKNNKFIKATRSSLIAGYLGQTAKATQKIIDSAQGGILFFDEENSLGSAEKRDSFSKECIDTLNENLTDKKTDFICIVAGYKDEIDSCFFAFNAGLERRFPVRFTIEPYKPNDLFQIFKKKVYDCEWSLDSSVNVNFFTKHYKQFKYFGGDMENLFSRCKRAHSRRVFASKDAEKKVLTIIDLNRGYDSFKAHRKTTIIKKDIV
jgi:SpoVK/Ycf46/Vps4 family AAA+-type ATPase